MEMVQQRNEITAEVAYCDFKKVAESGQCFRMRLIENNKYLLVSEDKYAYGYNSGCHAYIECEESDLDFWSNYLDVRTNYDFVSRDFMDSCNNLFVWKSVRFCEGLRLLKQNPFETLISFIISQRKNISAISACIESLCALYGHPIGSGIQSFPTAEELKGKDLSRVKGIGYRDVYVTDAVERCLNGLNLENLKEAGYTQAKEQLKGIYGVGNKVADCTCLYGLGYKDAFPIDVWVQRIIDDDFGGIFPYNDFNKNLGILQLFMFYYKRKGA